MIGLREYQQIKARLVARINQLFPLSIGDRVTASQAGGCVSSIEGRWLTSAYQAASCGLSTRHCRSG